MGELGRTWTLADRLKLRGKDPSQGPESAFIPAALDLSVELSAADLAVIEAKLPAVPLRALRALVAALRAARGSADCAEAEVFELRAQVDRLRGDAETFREATIVTGRKVARMRAVVEAARQVRRHHRGPRFEDMAYALYAALDALDGGEP